MIAMGSRATLLVLLASLLVVLGAPAGVMAAGGDEPGRTSSGEPRDPEYTEGVTAIQRGDFAGAIRRLEGVVARDPKNADAHNWLGYAIRKNGDPARSIAVYERALALDSGHRGAHEYIGEAYLAPNNLAKAKEHLARLSSLCFLPCAEYRDLKQAVEAYEKVRAAR